MPRRIPIAAARRFAEEHGLRQVIICAWDGVLTHVVTHGVDAEQCAQAAVGGNKVKAALGWPASLQEDPVIVRKLKAKVAELERQLAEALNGS